MKQLTLSQNTFFKPTTTFGGDLLKGKRKIRRPLDAKKPIHLILRAQTEKPVFLHQDNFINALIEKYAHQFSIKIYESSVNASHLHFVLSFNHRIQYQNFVRALSGRIAQQLHVSWMTRPYTRVLNWGRNFNAAKAYTIKNQKEAWGLISYTPRK